MNTGNVTSEIGGHFRRVNGSLLIRGFQREDQGRYICEDQHEGRTEQRFRLFIGALVLIFHKYPHFVYQ